MVIIGNELINTITNIIVFSTIPLLWYICCNKSIKGFLKEVGFYVTDNIKIKDVIGIGTGTYIISCIFIIITCCLDGIGKNMIMLQGKSHGVVLGYLLLFGIKTGVTEEIFFRGFMAKKLYRRLGLTKGNILQAILFSLMHLSAITALGTIDVIIRVMNAFMVGLIFGYIMEEKSEGSIIPVMILHIIFNAMTGFIYFIL